MIELGLTNWKEPTSVGIPLPHSKKKARHAGCSEKFDPSQKMPDTGLGIFFKIQAML